MTLLDQHGIRRALARPRLRRDEVDAVRSLTDRLPVLVRGGYSPPRPVCLEEALVRLDAAVWSAAAAHGVDVSCDCTIIDLTDELAAKGWQGPAARAALRALTMLRYAAGRRADTVEDEIAMCDAAARVVAYLELRVRFG
jgi:hypothetical protein